MEVYNAIEELRQYAKSINKEECQELQGIIDKIRSTTESKLKDAESKLEEHADEIGQLKLLIKEAIGIIRSQIKDLSAKRDQLKTTEFENDDLRKEVCELEGQIADKCSIIFSLESDIKQYVAAGESLL